MGLYDTIRVEGKQETREGQVKCWGEEMTLKTLGDGVPNIGDDYSYVIAMREGGFVIVFRNVLIAWEDEIPEENKDWPLFDKWGNPLFGNSLEQNIHGLMGNEPYFFRRKNGSR